jgi:hypothetical protein
MVEHYMPMLNKLVTQKLDQGEVPFYISKAELLEIKPMDYHLDWDTARQATEDCLRKWGDDKAIYRVRIDEGAFIGGEFKRQLKVEVKDLSKRMASYHLQKN